MSKLTDFVVDQFTPLQAAQHTLGPWKADSNAGCRSIRANRPDTGDIAYTSGLPDDDEDCANATLIAKAPIAPKLAEALRALSHLSATLNARQHAGMPVTAVMWSALYQATNEATAALAEWDAQS